MTSLTIRGLGEGSFGKVMSVNGIAKKYIRDFDEYYHERMYLTILHGMPGIVQAKNYGRVKPYSYEMEVYDGAFDQPMNHLFNDEQRISIVAQLLEGLRSMHSLNLCHGDLKGPNCLWRKKGSNKIEAVIADFGNACYNGCQGTHRTTMGCYTSHDIKYTKRTDLFALHRIVTLLYAIRDRDNYYGDMEYPIPVETIRNRITHEGLRKVFMICQDRNIDTNVNELIDILGYKGLVTSNTELNPALMESMSKLNLVDNIPINPSIIVIEAPTDQSLIDKTIRACKSNYLGSNLDLSSIVSKLVIERLDIAPLKHPVYTLACVMFVNHLHDRTLSIDKCMDLTGNEYQQIDFTDAYYEVLSLGRIIIESIKIE